MAIPSKQLVGQNVEFLGNIYSDDYIKALNKFASVDEVFGINRKAIAKGESNSVTRLIIDTLGKSEYENHLVTLIMTAAETGEWRAIEREPQHMPGLDIVVEKHFGHIIKYENKTFLLPSAMYLAYCKEYL